MRVQERAQQEIPRPAREYKIQDAIGGQVGKSLFNMIGSVKRDIIQNVTYLAVSPFFECILWSFYQALQKIPSLAIQIW